MLPAILAGGAAVSSIVGDLFNRDQAEQAKDAALAAFKKLLIPGAEIARRADAVGDNIYTQTMEELNRGAFSYRGSLNPETLKTIAYARMAGMRASEELKSSREDENYNRSIQAKIAEIEATPIPGINPADMISAGIEGYLAGTQIEMSQGLIDKQKQFYDVLMTDINRGNSPVKLDVSDIYSITPDKKKYNKPYKIPSYSTGMIDPR